MIPYFKTENLERSRARVFLTTKLPRKYYPINTIYKQHQRLNIVPKQNRALNIQATQHLKAHCKAWDNFDNWKHFKNDEKCFLLHLKSSFCSQDI